MTKARCACAAAVVALAIAGCATRTAVPPVPADPWRELPAWRDDDLSDAWSAYLASCRALANRVEWRDACSVALKTPLATPAQARAHFEAHYTPLAVAGANGEREGLMTGYYEPLLRGSRTPTARYRYPLYRPPADLLAGAPYFERSRLDAADTPLRGLELLWVDDAVELFFLQIQGSGRVALDSGETVRVGFAAHNGQPYRSIGRVLIDRGELTFEEASMQGIKAWAARNPERLKALLDTNPRYVFFRELPPSPDGPPGALGVPLTPQRSLAVDAKHIALGAPVYVSTTWPATDQPLNRLMFAHDTGGAITGPLRTDFYWGSGDEAGRYAGRTRQRARLWLLVPKGVHVTPR